MYINGNKVQENHNKRSENQLKIKMSTIVMHMAIPSKPINYVHKLDKKPSNLCSVSSSAATACHRLHCSAQLDDPVVPAQRRSGNYSPPLWDIDFIQSLNSEYKVMYTYEFLLLLDILYIYILLG